MLSLCPFPPLTLDSKTLKGFTSQITVRRGEQRRGEWLFILWPCFLWQRYPQFYLHLSCLAAAFSQNVPGISISSSLPIFPHRSSVQCVLLAGILHGAYCQSAKILHWENPQRDISHESKQRFALIIKWWELKLIDALSSPLVSWWVVGWQWGLSGGKGSQQMWQGDLRIL